MIRIFAALFCLAIGAAHAQSPFKISADRALAASEFGARTLDMWSTHRALNAKCGCNYEADPLAPHGKGWGGDAAFQYGASVAINFGAIELRKHHHEKWARALLIVDMADESVATVNNVRRFNATGIGRK